MRCISIILGIAVLLAVTSPSNSAEPLLAPASLGIAANSALSSTTPHLKAGCEWLESHLGANGVGFSLPNGGGYGEQFYFVRFGAEAACTLGAVKFKIFDPSTSGEPTLLVQLFGDASTIMDSLEYPTSAATPFGGPNLIGSMELPYADLQVWPLSNLIDLRAFGPHAIDSGQSFFFTIGMTPNSLEEGDRLTLFFDNVVRHSAIEGSHTGWYALEGDSAVFRYIGEYGGGWLELAMGALVCSGDACICTSEGDIDNTGYADAADLNILIDALYFGGTTEPEPLCQWYPADFSASGMIDAVDLHLMIQYLFFNGPGPLRPCTAPY